MNHFLMLLGLVTLCGCSTLPRAKQVPADAPLALNQDFRREHHEAFSSREREMIVAAKRYLAQSDKRPKGASKDAYYRVRHSADGYEVFITYVAGYEGSRPLFEPCLHNAVLLTEDGSLLKVLTGPEGWP